MYVYIYIYMYIHVYIYIYIIMYPNYRTIVRGVISCYIPTIPTTGGLNMPNFDFHLPSPTHRGLGTPQPAGLERPKDLEIVLANEWSIRGLPPFYDINSVTICGNMVVSYNGCYTLMVLWCFMVVSYDYLIEGSLEVKLPTIWTDEKQSREEAERRGRLEERRSEEKE